MLYPYKFASYVINDAKTEWREGIVDFSLAEEKQWDAFHGECVGVMLPVSIYYKYMWSAPSSHSGGFVQK